MLHHAPTSPFAVETDAERFAKRRLAIDLIATSRARAIRSALFGSYLFRANPFGPEPASVRAHWRDVLREQFDALARAAAVVRGSDPMQQVPDWVCDWIGAHGAAHPHHADAFAQMRDLTHEVVLAVDTDDKQQMRDALDAHLKFGRSGFFETVTEFCDGLWADLDATRHQEVERASAAGQAIGKTLTRLEQIGKHVRLVSLNASVEAARVGDAGRGLGVIAVEFKTLAEEIQRLSVTARADIAAMTGVDPTDRTAVSRH